MMGPTADDEAFARKNGFKSYTDMKNFAAARSGARKMDYVIQDAKPAEPKRPRQAPQAGGLSGVLNRITSALGGK
jgi:hypothetical protein